MNEKELVKNAPLETEPKEARLVYNAPVLEEYGSLHELTHGGEGVDYDSITHDYSYTPL